MIGKSVSLAVLLATLAITSTVLDSASAHSTTGGQAVQHAQATRFSSPPFTVHAVGGAVHRLHRRDTTPDTNRGAGIRVGIIDSGIDYKHPALGGCFGKGCKVAYGYDFVGDDYDGMNDPQPDDLPLDECHGHGTHVAGLIAADSEVFKGAAPDAILGAYRVFGCSGETQFDVVLQAMQRAAADKMDVVNLSLGTTHFFSDTTDALAVQHLVDQGIVVVASAGAGYEDTHLGAVSSPGTAPGALSVAALTHSPGKVNYFTGKQAGQRFEYTSSTGAALPSTTPTMLSLADAKEEYGCDGLSGSFTGQFVVLKHGKCTLTRKARQAKAAGAAGVVVILDTLDVPSAAVSSKVGVPVIVVDEEHGKRLMAALYDAENKPQIQVVWQQDNVDMNSKRSSLIGVLSSFGPSSNMSTVKPEIAGKGQRVLSTYPLKLGKYAVITGTGVAAPQISALAARLLALHAYRVDKRDRPALVRRAIMQSSQPTHWPAKTTAPLPTGTAGQILPVPYAGAGVASSEALNDASWGLHPTSVGFVGNGDGTSTSRTFTLQLVGDIPPGTVDFRFVHAIGISDWQSGTLSPNRYLQESAELVASPQRVTIGPSADNGLMQVHHQTVSITIKTPELADTSSLWILSGVIEAVHYNTTTKQQSVRRIPYQATVGRLNSTAPLQRTDNYPRLMTAFNFTLVDGQPTVHSGKRQQHIATRFRTILPVAKVFTTIEHAEDGRVLGMADRKQARNLPISLAGVENDFWKECNGYYREMPSIGESHGAAKPIPKGRYRFRLHASRPFTSLRDAASYEQWVSPDFDVEDVVPYGSIFDNNVDANGQPREYDVSNAFGHIM